MASGYGVSSLESQVSTDAAPPKFFTNERGPVLQESDQTPVAGVVNCGNEQYDKEFIKNNLEPSIHGSSSFSWSDSCSSFEGDKWLRELQLHENVMPPELRIEYYDVMVLYSEDNRADACKFCDHLKNDIKLKHKESVKAVLYDEFVPQAGSKFKLLETALERCTYIFFYITKEFCEDKWIELSREECLMEAIENETKRRCVVPVYTVDPKAANLKIPMGLRSLKGIYYYYNDQFYRHGVSGLIQNKLHQRLEKEKQHQFKQSIWLQSHKRKLSTEIENKKSLENMEILRIPTQMEQKMKETAVNEVVLTGADQEHLRSTMYQRAENKGQAGKPQSQERDKTANNSTQSADQLFQKGSTNLMEPASEWLSAYGNIPNMALLDSQDSTLAPSSINSFNGDARPLQGENPTGISHDETGLPFFEALSLNPSFDWMSLTSDDQSETRDTSSSPLSQKSRRRADAIKASMTLNIYHVENLQLGEKSTIIKSKQTNEKSKNEADHNDATKGDFVHNEQKDEEYLPVPGNRSVAEMKAVPASVANQHNSKQSQDCMTLSSRNRQGLKLSLLKPKAEAEEEEKQFLGTNLKDYIKSGKEEEEGFLSEMKKRDQYSHLGAGPKDHQEKPVAKVPPSPIVSLTSPIRKSEDRDNEETDLNTVAIEASNETGVETVQETLAKLVAEPNATKRASLFREKQQADLNQYQVIWRSDAPLLARAFAFVSFPAKMIQYFQRDVMSSQPITSGQDPFSQGIVMTSENEGTPDS